MNILISDSWLKEFIETKANPKEIAEYLSLCSQSVEKTSPTENDFLYDIEITTNRSDCFSVYGIARELSAILPKFNIPTILKPQISKEVTIPKIKDVLPLEVEITDQSFCPRFTALIFDNITIKPSPKIIQERLEKSGIRALNNVIDISNYLMLELGQPMHTFDYDKIGRSKMILRESRKGEKITTLDEQNRPLPEGTIIIEDGDSKIIDLCGIMGGKNSAVDSNTKRVLLFVQTYDPAKIRKTCQLMGFRTDAASRFEKGVDPEGVMIAMKKAVLMFQENCEARINSNLIDIYPNPPKQKTVQLDSELIAKIIGIEIQKNDVVKILESLGFKISIRQLTDKFQINCLVPHWRYSDISIPEDLIEEVARIYGYFNLPNNLPVGQISQNFDNNYFESVIKIKKQLKFLGYSEIYNYSMISDKYLESIGYNPEKCLKIANPLSEEWVYLRPSLIPSSLEIIAKNQNEFEKIRIFEMANTYIPVDTHTLPNEIYTLLISETNTDFYHQKGLVEAILEELGIKNYSFKPLEKNLIEKTYDISSSSDIFVNTTRIGMLGKINSQVIGNFSTNKKDIWMISLSVRDLINLSNKIKKYTIVPKYPPVIEDITVVTFGNITYENIVNTIKENNEIISTINLIDSFENARTFRIYYQHPQRTLTNKEVKDVRQKILKSLKDIGVTIKAKPEV